MADYRPELIKVEEVRSLIAELQRAEGNPGTYLRAANAAERRQIVHDLRSKLDAATLEELRSLAQSPATETAKVAQNVKELLQSFVDAQRQRMERRKKLESLRARTGRAGGEP